MTSFKKTRELLAGSYLADIISDEESVLLYDCSFSKNLELPYEEYERFDLEEMADSECRTELRVNKRDLLRCFLHLHSTISPFPLKSCTIHVQ